MGSILQERATPRCVERASIKDREWKKVSWCSGRPNVSSNRMGRRQSQRKSPQPQNPDQNQENHHEKRPQRRKHKSNNPSSRCNAPSPRVQGSSASRPQRCGHRDVKHSSMRGSKHTAVSSFSDSSRDLQERRSIELDALLEDSDTDLSETERLPVSPSGRVPPQLELRPEVMEGDIPSSSHHHRTRQAQGGLDFPDFLPPPFNSWSLSQLAVFYNVEGRAAPRPRPVGPLERYLERLLQLEWLQIQTVQEESGTSAVPEPASGCRSAAAATSRLSSPKCILNCQRAFPLTFLSSLASHSTLLSGCACTPCQIRYSSCSLSCCRPIHGLGRQSRLSPMLERSRRPTLLPKRSYSESRVLPSERRCSSPGGTNSYLRRMQASGNIRNPIQGATSRPHSSVRDSADHAGKGDAMDSRMGAWRRRSGSEQRRGGAERQQNGPEKRRSGSECRKGRSERRRDFKEREVKPDAVAAIMDNLPASKAAPIRRPSRTKQVEFVT